MVTALPPFPNIAHLKRQAKQLVRAHRHGRSESCEVLRNLRRFSGLDNQSILASSVALHDAQYAMAIEYGFNNWNALRQHVESMRLESQTTPSIVNRDSLAATVDAVNDAQFFSRQISNSQKRELAEYIAGRQGLRGSYGKLFAPMPKDASDGFRLYTGERIAPGPGARHILGEEAFRALLVLGVRTSGIQEAMSAAWQPFDGWLNESLRRPPRPAGGNQPGMFCCMKCSCALWRHLAARGNARHEAFLAVGVKALKMCRNGEGGWKFWPFHYTLLTLSEINVSLANEELRYAAKACERELSKRSSRTNTYTQRRRALLERVLVRIEQ